MTADKHQSNMAKADCVQNESPSYSPFRYVNHILFCENIALCELEQQVGNGIQKDNGAQKTTPLFVYSRQQLLNNIKAYQDAVHSANMDERIKIFYAVKANANLHLMNLFRQEKTGAVTVSGFELLAALKVGFEPSSILLNGNGKQKWEIELAVRNGCMLNVDSIFDAENIVSAAGRLQMKTRVLIRVNPELDRSSTPVHQYLATALKDSKFGVSLNQLDKVLGILQKENMVEVIGLHCHIGSTIKDASVYETVVQLLLEIREKVKVRGINVQYLDIGGGLGIDYYRGTKSDEAPISSVADLIRAVASALPPDVNLILEPGRSLVANAGLILTRVLGTKGADEPGKIVIVDAAMTDLIRPSFYKAYHHILPVVNRPNSVGAGAFDIVGPVCESGDFLALKRELRQAPVKEDLLAIMDAGAYGMAMSSNYNMRGRAAEVLVDGDFWRLIRRREDFNSLIQSMTELS